MDLSPPPPNSSCLGNVSSTSYAVLDLKERLMSMQIHLYLYYYTNKKNTKESNNDKEIKKKTSWKVENEKYIATTDKRIIKLIIICSKYTLTSNEIKSCNII